MASPAVTSIVTFRPANTFWSEGIAHFALTPPGVADEEGSCSFWGPWGDWGAPIARPEHSKGAGPFFTAMVAVEGGSWRR